jgi:hypothetical protein
VLVLVPALFLVASLVPVLVGSPVPVPDLEQKWLAVAWLMAVGGILVIGSPRWCCLSVFGWCLRRLFCAGS